MCQRHRNGARTRPDIGNPHTRPILQPRDRSFHQVLCFWPRDQHIRRHLKRQAKKFLLAGNVLDGHTAQTLLDSLVECLRLQRR